MSSLRSMVARGAHEEHRPSTPLELFVDLCFVVAVAQAASTLHHGLAEGHLGQVLVGYPMVFFAIWWAWMNFTWFASAYDNDDVPYRLAVFVQVAGILILAAGLPDLVTERSFGVVVLGYVVMRLALVGQWLRAAASDQARRTTCRRYAAGVAACQVGWLSLLVLPSSVRPLAFVVMVACELAVPMWAERAEPTTWHPHHIAERYGLFTIIVLGESILAATLAVQSGFEGGEALGRLAFVAAGGLVVVCAMWWIYFAQPTELLMDEARDEFESTSSGLSFLWGYGHYVVFGSAAAVGAGIAVVVDEVTGAARVSGRAAALAVAVPVALYLLSVWLLHQRTWPGTKVKQLASPIAALVVLALGALGAPLLAIGAVLVVLIAVATASGHRKAGPTVISDPEIL